MRSPTVDGRGWSPTWRTGLMGKRRRKRLAAGSIAAGDPAVGGSADRSARDGSLGRGARMCFVDLFHFSHDPSIERFTPHVPATNPSQSPSVWAIDAEHAPLYWFPRNCPRVTASTDVGRAEGQDFGQDFGQEIWRKGALRADTRRTGRLITPARWHYLSRDERPRSDS